eukprot:gene2708-1968_t
MAAPGLVANTSDVTYLLLSFTGITNAPGGPGTFPCSSLLRVTILVRNQTLYSTTTGPLKYCRWLSPSSLMVFAEGSSHATMLVTPNVSSIARVTVMSSGGMRSIEKSVAIDYATKTLTVSTDSETSVAPSAIVSLSLASVYRRLLVQLNYSSGSSGLARWRTAQGFIEVQTPQTSSMVWLQDVASNLTQQLQTALTHQLPGNVIALTASDSAWATLTAMSLSSNVSVMASVTLCNDYGRCTTTNASLAWNATAASTLPYEVSLSVASSNVTCSSAVVMAAALAPWNNMTHWRRPMHLQFVWQRRNASAAGAPFYDVSTLSNDPATLRLARFSLSPAVANVFRLTIVDSSTQAALYTSSELRLTCYLPLLVPRLSPFQSTLTLTAGTVAVLNMSSSSDPATSPSAAAVAAIASQTANVLDFLAQSLLSNQDSSGGSGVQIVQVSTETVKLSLALVSLPPSSGSSNDSATTVNFLPAVSIPDSSTTINIAQSAGASGSAMISVASFDSSLWAAATSSNSSSSSPSSSPSGTSLVSDIVSIKVSYTGSSGSQSLPSFVASMDVSDDTTTYLIFKLLAAKTSKEVQVRSQVKEVLEATAAATAAHADSSGDDHRQAAMAMGKATSGGGGRRGGVSLVRDDSKRSMVATTTTDDAADDAGAWKTSQVAPAESVAAVSLPSRQGESSSSHSHSHSSKRGRLMSQLQRRSPTVVVRPATTDSESAAAREERRRRRRHRRQCVEYLQRRWHEVAKVFIVVKLVLKTPTVTYVIRGTRTKCLEPWLALHDPRIYGSSVTSAARAHRRGVQQLQALRQLIATTAAVTKRTPRTAIDQERLLILQQQLQHATHEEFGMTVLQSLFCDILDQNCVIGQRFTKVLRKDFPIESYISETLQRLLTAFIVLLNLGALYYVVLKGTSRGIGWQRSLLRVCFLDWFIEVVVHQTFEVYFVHFVLPNLIYEDVQTTLAAMLRAGAALITETMRFRGVVPVGEVALRATIAETITATEAAAASATTAAVAIKSDDGDAAARALVTQQAVLQAMVEKRALLESQLALFFNVDDRWFAAGDTPRPRRVYTPSSVTKNPVLAQMWRALFVVSGLPLPLQRITGGLLSSALFSAMSTMWITIKHLDGSGGIMAVAVLFLVTTIALGLLYWHRRTLFYYLSANYLPRKIAAIAPAVHVPDNEDNVNHGDAVVQGGVSGGRRTMATGHRGRTISGETQSHASSNGSSWMTNDDEDGFALSSNSSDGSSRYGDAAIARQQWQAQQAQQQQQQHHQRFLQAYATLLSMQQQEAASVDGIAGSWLDNDLPLSIDDDVGSDALLDTAESGLLWSSLPPLMAVPSWHDEDYGGNDDIANAVWPTTMTMPGGGNDLSLYEPSDASLYGLLPDMTGIDWEESKSAFLFDNASYIDDGDEDDKLSYASGDDGDWSQMPLQSAPAPLPLVLSPPLVSIPTSSEPPSWLPQPSPLMAAAPPVNPLHYGDPSYPVEPRTGSASMRRPRLRSTSMGTSEASSSTHSSVDSVDSAETRFYGFYDPAHDALASGYDSYGNGYGNGYGNSYDDGFAHSYDNE